MNQFNELHLFDEVNHMVQAGIDMPPVISNGADPYLCPLPEVLIPHLRDGHIESVFYPVDHLFENLTLAFQGMILWNSKVKQAYSNDHLPLLLLE
jgi:hypothetical protein